MLLLTDAPTRQLRLHLQSFSHIQQKEGGVHVRLSHHDRHAVLQWRHRRTVAKPHRVVHPRRVPRKMVVELAEVAAAAAVVVERW